MEWHIVDHNAPKVFDSLSATCSVRGNVITQARTRDLLHVETSGQHYYVKRYWSAGKGLRAVCFRSRARAEWENLQYFKQCGLPTPPLVAYGEKRSCFRYARGAFVMHALSDVFSFESLLSQGVLSRIARLDCLKQIAEGLRKLHDHRFIHGDAFIRNYLVSHQDGTVFFTDCPRGKRLWGPFFNYGRVRDLASFYKGAANYLSLTDRLRFFLWYRGEDTLTPQGWFLLQQIMNKNM